MLSVLRRKVGACLAISTLFFLGYQIEVRAYEACFKYNGGGAFNRWGTRYTYECNGTYYWTECNQICANPQCPSCCVPHVDPYVDDCFGWSPCCLSCY